MVIVVVYWWELGVGGGLFEDVCGEVGFVLWKVYYGFLVYEEKGIFDCFEVDEWVELFVGFDIL